MAPPSEVATPPHLMGYGASTTKEKVLIDGVTAATHSTPVRLEDFYNSVLHIHTSGSADLRIRVKGSQMDDLPDWTSAQSESNRWEFLQMIDLDSGVYITGNQGVQANGTDIHKRVAINDNYVRHAVVEIDQVNGGRVTVTLRAATH